MPLAINPSAMDMGGTLQLRGNWAVRNMLEAASADFDAGECVILSGDDITQTDTAPSANAFSAALADNVRIYGVALKDASGTTGTVVPIAYPLDSSAEMLIRVGSTTTGSDQEVQDVAIGGAIWATTMQSKITDLDRGQTGITRRIDEIQDERSENFKESRKWREDYSRKVSEIQADVRWIREIMERKQ